MKVKLYNIYEDTFKSAFNRSNLAPINTLASLDLFLMLDNYYTLSYQNIISSVVLMPIPLNKGFQAFIMKRYEIFKRLDI